MDLIPECSKEMRLFKTLFLIPLVGTCGCRDSSEDLSLKSGRIERVSSSHDGHSHDGHSHDGQSFEKISELRKKWTIDENFDLAALFNQESQIEVNTLLEFYFSKSSDPYELAKRLFENYSGDYINKVTLSLSYSMRSHPTSFIKAVLEKLPRHSHEETIRNHIAIQMHFKNFEGLDHLYHSLDTGMFRTLTGNSLAIFKFKQHGLDEAIQTIQNLDFQSEKNAAVISLLSTIRNTQNNISAIEKEQILTAVSKFENSENIKNDIEIYFDIN